MLKVSTPFLLRATLVFSFVQGLCSFVHDSQVVFKNHVVYPGLPKLQKPHAVEHVALLNNEGFWYLMGVMILCVGAAVIRVEIHNSSAREKAKLMRKNSTNSSSNPSASQIRDYSRNNTLHLVFCVVALNICMLLWGIAQEFVSTNRYTDKLGHKAGIPNALFLVLCNRMVSVIFSGSLITCNGKSLSFDGFWLAGPPAITNGFASWCQYESLNFISFTLQTTAKSSKLLPVVLLSAIRGKDLTILDFAEALVIVFATVIFGLEVEQDQFIYTTQIGILLLCGLVLFDSLTPHLQDFMFKKTNMETIQATFGMSCFASVAILVVMFLDTSIFECAHFLWRYPTALLHLTVLSLSSTLTQYMISYTIKTHGPIIFTLIATTRQVISVCMSAVLFQHNMPTLAWVAAVMIFGTVAFRAIRPMYEADTSLDVEKTSATPEAAKDPESRIAMPAPGPDQGWLFTSYWPLVMSTIAIHFL